MDEHATDWSAPVRAPDLLVSSPHLLVAQAVSAALQSVGLLAEPRPWAEVFGTAGGSQADGCVLALLESGEDAVAVTQVGATARADRLRVLVVVADGASIGWGQLLRYDGIEVATDVTSVGELSEVVGRFVRGQRVMAPEERERLRATWSEDLERRRDLRRRVESLSPQQLRVLELLAAGRPVLDVAESIGVAAGTVRSHIKSLRGKLGARTQLEAVAMLRLVKDDEVLGPPPEEDGGGSGPLVPEPGLRV